MAYVIFLGTGKTSVIAAMVQSMLLQDSEEETVWIIAQSNVAVKNVAEKLVKIGLNEFKLVVSNEFYFQWSVIPRLPIIRTLMIMKA